LLQRVKTGIIMGGVIKDAGLSDEQSRKLLE